jgi:hypothetical protein
MTDEIGEKLVKAIDGIYFALEGIAEELRTLNERLERTAPEETELEEIESGPVDLDFIDALTEAHDPDRMLEDQ